MGTSAIFVDFDNLFGGLFALDPAAAKQSARSPQTWVEHLAERHLTGDTHRRWTVRRCYMNPNGSLLEGTTRLYLSQYRAFFVQAGFEVVDCPPLTKRAKNGADIRIVLDALDLLASADCPEEIVIASSDSDFTPLLHRIRRADCRIALITAGDAVPAYRAIADQVLDAPTFLDLLEDEPDEEVGGSPVLEPAATAEAAVAVPPETDVAAARDRFAALVGERYTAATEPLNLARLSADVRTQLGPVVRTSDWFGFGSFTTALKRLGLEGLLLNQRLLWDARRHEAPPDDATLSGLPDTIAQVAAVSDLPKISAELWPSVFGVLAEYAASHTFNLTESTKWTRDRLAEQGFAVGRNVLAFALQGATLGGASLSASPPPDAGRIATAFFDALVYRVNSAGLFLDDDQTAELRTWLGVPESAGSDDVGTPEVDGGVAAEGSPV